jgi:hypothetical protein
MPRYHFVVCEPDHTHVIRMECTYKATTPQKIVETASCMN